MDKISVILADDHRVVRDGLRALLSAEPDIEVVGDAEDGAQAVALAEKFQPDVVIIDILMPGITGIEAARQILDRHPTAAIIMLSMYASREYIHRALQAGCQGYVLKESAGSEVISAVREVARGRRYLSQKITDVLVDEFLIVDPGSRSPIESLSDRELEVVQLVVEGRTSAEIAGVLHLSPKTVDTYRQRAMKKLDVEDLPGLIRFALQHGLGGPQATP